MTEQAQEKTAVSSRGRLARTWWVWVAVIGLLALIAWGLVNNTETRPQVGDPVPEFSLEMLNGYSVDGETVLTTEDLAGQVVVVNFWASWCVECTYETDDLQAIADKYPQDEVLMLGIAYLDEEDRSLEFLERFNVTYPNGFDRGSTISDETFFLTGVPETFIIDQEGNIAQVFIGPVEEAQLTAIIDSLLN